jgi:hypothetical protein
LKLIPNASHEKQFPVPHEGVDESEGVVVFEAVLPDRSDQHRWVAVAYTTNEERGWILGEFVQDKPIVGKFSVHGTLIFRSTFSETDESYALDLFYRDASIAVNTNGILTRVYLPSLLSNALLVYRVTAIHAEGQLCTGVL